MLLTATAFLTLDGVMQAPGGPDEDRTGGFAHGGWMIPFFGEDDGRVISAWFAGADAFLLGRRTYDIFASHWPHVTDPDDPVATLLNRCPKYVVSSTNPSLNWENSTLITGDVVTQIDALKQAPGNELQVHGSGRLLATLLNNDLVDELRLITYPVTVGSGYRFFPEGLARTFDLVTADTTSGGALVTTYRATGTPKYGTAALVEEDGVVKDSVKPRQ